jgi:hypothetical protein
MRHDCGDPVRIGSPQVVIPPPSSWQSARSRHRAVAPQLPHIDTGTLGGSVENNMDQPPVPNERFLVCPKVRENIWLRISMQHENW